MYRIKVVEDADLKSKITDSILHQLPHWFGIEESIQNYIETVRNMVFYAVFVTHNGENGENSDNCYQTNDNASNDMGTNDNNGNNSNNSNNSNNGNDCNNCNSGNMGEKAIGFLALKSNNLYTAELYVLGILQEYHRKNIGRSMVARAEQYLREHNYRFLMVKTLSDSSDDESYAKTRRFYTSLGFYPLEEIAELWGKENPCLIMVKNL